MSHEILQWHPGFVAAVKAELMDYRDELEFKREYNLTRKPLQMDLLVVKKEDGVEIRNPLGEKFRRYNVMEYKSPKDVLSVDDFYKVLAYAFLFKAEAEHGVNSIKANELTIFFICSKRPVKLIRHLKRLYDIEITERYRDIYDLEGCFTFPIQMVITGKNWENCKWLNALRDDLKTADKEYICHLLEENRLDKDDNKNAVIELMIKANKHVIEELKEGRDMLSDVLRELMAPEIAEEKQMAAELGKKIGNEQRAKIVARNMFNREYSAEDASGMTEFDPERIKTWYQEWEKH